MDRARFRDWVSSIDELTAARCPGASRAVCAAIAANPAAGLSGPSPARRQGAQARPVARAGADPGRRRSRGGATLSRTLPKLDADSVKRALAPVIAPDALLVSDAGRCHRPAARHSSRERQPLRRRAGSRGGAHPDGQQPPQPDQGLPAALPRHRHQVSRQLSEVVPSRRPRQASIAKSMPRGGQRQDMPAIHELSFSFSLRGRILYPATPVGFCRA